jgi:hypothetical protein
VVRNTDAGTRSHVKPSFWLRRRSVRRQRLGSSRKISVTIVTNRNQMFFRDSLM